MSQTRRVYLDLFPADADRATASWSVEGKSVLDWQLDFLRRQRLDRVFIQDVPAARTLAGFSRAEGFLEWTGEVPRKDRDLIVPVGWVLDRVGFRSALRGKTDLSAIRVWQIRSQEDLLPAATEWTRNNWLPFGTDYIKHAAHAVAAAALRTPLTPNHLTLGTLLCAIGVAGLLWADLPGWNWLAPLLVIGAVVLDFADGRLARLKGLGSRYGAYLDSTVGDLTEDICYLGIIGYLYLHEPDRAIPALALGVLYFFGKYQAYLSLQYQRLYIHAPVVESGQAVEAPLSSQNTLAGLFVVFEFTTIRYHLLAGCLLIGQPLWPLAFYAVHFNARWILRVALVTWREGRTRRP